MSIAQRLSHLKAALPEHVTLVAVSKFHPPEAIREAYAAGQRVFGENRVQELAAKQPLLPPDIEWHFVGTLQTNKVKYIAPFVHTIQSVDSVHLLQEIDRQAARCRRTIRVLLEIHIAREASKHGFTIDACRTLLSAGAATRYPHLCVAGLMGMATFTDDGEQIRSEFGRLHAFFAEVRNASLAGRDFATLSMGMSDDYPAAVACGSTMVRIGTGVFGTRCAAEHTA